MLLLKIGLGLGLKSDYRVRILKSCSRPPREQVTKVT